MRGPICPTQAVESNSFPLDFPRTLSLYPLLLLLLSISFKAVALSHLTFAFISELPPSLPACLPCGVCYLLTCIQTARVPLSMDAVPHEQHQRRGAD